MQLHVAENAKNGKTEEKKTENKNEEKPEIISLNSSALTTVSEENKTETESDSVTELILILTETIDSLEMELKVSTVRACVRVRVKHFSFDVVYVVLYVRVLKWYY